MNEEEMKEATEELKKIPGMPKPIFIKITYDEELQKITGTKEDPTYMSQGSMFIYLLQNVFMTYPEIEKNYPPGSLGFTINDIPPNVYSPLFDGDIVSFHILTNLRM